MIDTKALRSRVLDLAIQGKLTEQLPSDGTAEVLFNINDTSFEEDIPYEVPNNWKWVKLSNIGTTNIGLTYHPSDVDNNGTIVIRSSNIVNGKMDYSDIVKVNCSIKENQYVNKNDIVICARNGSKALVGKNAIYNDESGKVAFGAFMAIFRTEYYAYVQLFFNTKSFRRYFSSDDSKQINQVTQTILKNSIIPLPPLAEQKRIVERVEEIFRLLDAIDEAQEKYSADAESLKAKLITAGIQGKLTKQLPSDGTAEELYQQIQAEKQALIKEGKIKKEKPLPEIKPEEVPFEIPGSWKWCRLGEISNTIWAGRDKPNDFTEEADELRSVPVVANGVANDGILGYTGTATAPANTITVAGRGTIGFSVYRTYEYCPIVRLVVIEQAQQIEPRYLQYYLKLVPATSVGSSIPQLTVPMIRPKLVPLPPLAEQKRIADVLERVLGELW